MKDWTIYIDGRERYEEIMGLIEDTKEEFSDA